MKRHEMSEITSFERISLDELESPVVKQGAAYWLGLCGGRRFPSYEDLHPRDFASILANTLLVKIVDGGADFEFRIVGDAQMQTYALPFAGKRLSEMAQTNIAYCYVLKGLFGHVAAFREPVAVRGQLGPGFPHVRFGYFESLFLPLGATDGAVDYLLGFSAYGPGGTR
jgi:hypothetical protein